MHRINDFIITDKTKLASLLAPFDDSLTILDFSLLKDSMSNTGYMVTTDSGKYFLKLYSNTTDRIETAALSCLKDKINVPALLFYDGSKQRFPFAYAVTEFLDGVTFIEHVRASLNYPPETAERLCKFIKEKSELFDSIEAGSVLCHGDLGYGNIMISHGKVYFIDFEFTYSGSIYHDIGHFFRRKDDDVEALIGRHIYDAFAQGYHSVSAVPLPSNWLKLAHLCDISAMLCLLTYDNVPTEWVADIENDILCAIDEGSRL